MPSQTFNDQCVFVKGIVSHGDLAGATVPFQTGDWKFGRDSTALGEADSVFLGRASGHGSLRLVPIPDSAECWLDAALILGVPKIVCGTQHTLGATGEVTGTVTEQEGGCFYAEGKTHALKVFPYKTVNGIRVYGNGTTSDEVTDNNNATEYDMVWEWDAVQDAEGYRIFKYETGTPVYTYNIYVDVETNAYTETTDNRGNWLIVDDLNPATPAPTETVDVFGIYTEGEEQAPRVGVGLKPLNEYFEVAKNARIHGFIFARNQMWFEPVTCVATSNLDMSSAEYVVDDITLADGQTVVLTAQDTVYENGIYTLVWDPNSSLFNLVRREDCDAVHKLAEGQLVYIQQGTSGSGTWWMLTNAPSSLTSESDYIQFARSLDPVLSNFDTLTFQSGGMSGYLQFTNEQGADGSFVANRPFYTLDILSTLTMGDPTVDTATWKWDTAYGEATTPVRAFMASGSLYIGYTMYVPAESGGIRFTYNQEESDNRYVDVKCADDGGGEAFILNCVNVPKVRLYGASLYLDDGKAIFINGIQVLPAP